jgi:hypothetical protein
LLKDCVWPEAGGPYRCLIKPVAPWQNINLHVDQKFLRKRNVMKFPLTLNEIENLSRDDVSLKPLLREIFRFPCDTPKTQRNSLRTQAIQRIDDIVMFHRFAMFTHTQTNQIVAPVFEAFNKHYNLMFSHIGNEPEKISSSRLAFRNFNDVAQLRQIECIANESLIINLWATIEQISTRCLAMVSDNTPGKRAPHKWKDIESHYEDINIILKRAVSYATIDELRVLNNKIKHSYLVDDELSSFDFFKDQANRKIDAVPLRVFDYTLAAYNFVCFVTNRSGENEFYPENEEDDYDEEG